ncbi:hypothetical protein PCO31110_00949 [Pandoraea communis]|uniref:Uncharacterized protein n=1 Tax=Pandoraea communis TaxID=2508297 RepID=A0A5E4SUH7_9BURK|nr:hypothetical protein C266_15342 [Pandoraea sp. SD6-2]VVD77449.1 hypothetical protein PCO31110_00949 [Pandoraea communis]
MDVLRARTGYSAAATRRHDNPIPERSNVSEKFQGQILREFGELIGIPSLTFDEHGACCFVVDEDFELAILRTDDQLSLTLPIDFPEAAMQIPARHLLSLFPPMTVDTLRGESPVIAWHPQASRAVAIVTLSRHLASAEQLAAYTVEFLEWCTHWRNVIRRDVPAFLHANPGVQRNDPVHWLALR